jgi:hypothetical protein
VEDFQAWSLWVFAISVGLAVLAAGWTARVSPELRPEAGS